MHGRTSAWGGLALLFLVALALRLAAVAVLFDTAHAPYEYEHGEIARNLLAGEGFAIRYLGADGPTSQQAPFYPLLLSGVYAYLGAGTTTSLLVVQSLQALVGAATAVMVAQLCFVLLPARRELGWIAGGIAAANPIQIYAVLHLQVAVWATAALVLALLLSVSRLREDAKAVSVGVVAGCMLLVEPILVLAIPVLSHCLWRWNTNQRRARIQLRSQAICVACLAATLAPWLWRNYAVHGEFVFVKSTFGYAFWQGNNVHSHGTDKIPKPSVETIRQAHDGTLGSAHQALAEARHETLYIDDVLLTADDKAQLGALSEPARGRSLMRRAMSELTPTRYVGLCAQRLRYFLTFDDTNPKAAHPIYRGVTVAWLISLGVGLWLLRGSWRELAPLWTVFVLVALFHTLTITAPRFRLPVEVLTYVWSAATVTLVAHWLAAWVRPGATRVALSPPRIAGHVAFRQHARRPRRKRESALTTD